MPTPVSPIPTLGLLAPLRTGQPVSASHWLRMSEEISHLAGRRVHVVGSTVINDRPSGRTSLAGLTYSVPFTYVRNPSASVVIVVVEIASVSARSQSVVTVTYPTGAAWIEANGLDNTDPDIYSPPTGAAAPEPLYGIIDVSACAAGTPLEFLFNFSGGSPVQGARRISIAEVPQSQLADWTEPHVDSSWTLYPNALIDGYSDEGTYDDTLRGFQRVGRCLDRLREETRIHCNWSGIESTDNTGTATNPHWHGTNGLGGIQWQQTQAVVNLQNLFFWVPTRAALYYPKRTTAWTARFRYKTSSTNAPTIRLTTKGVGSATTTNQDVSLASTSNVWTWARRTVVLPADGTDGTVRVWWQANAGTAGQLVQVSDFALIEKSATWICAWSWGATATPDEVTYVRSGTWSLPRSVLGGDYTETYAADTWGTATDSQGRAYFPVRRTYTNAATAPRDQSNAAWTAGTATATYNDTAGPDGTVLAERMNCASGQNGNYQNVALSGAGTRVNASWYYKGATPNDDLQGYVVDFTASVTVRNRTANTGVWVRENVQIAANAVGAILLVPSDGADLTVYGGFNAGARDHHVDMAMVVENVDRVQPYTDGTVGSTLLSIPGYLLMSPSGRWHCVLSSTDTVADEGAATPAVDTYLLYWDANNNFRLRASDNAFVLRLGGADVCVGAARSYLAGDSIGRIECWNRTDSCGFRVGEEIVTAAAAGASTVPATVYLFSNNLSTGVFPCDLYSGPNGEESFEVLTLAA